MHIGVVCTQQFVLSPFSSGNGKFDALPGPEINLELFGNINENSNVKSRTFYRVNRILPEILQIVKSILLESCSVEYTKVYHPTF